MKQSIFRKGSYIRSEAGLMYDTKTIISVNVVIVEICDLIYLNYLTLQYFTSKK